MPGLKLYYWQSGRNNRGFCINGGISLRFPSLQQHLNGGLDVIAGKEQHSFILLLVMQRPFLLILGILLVIALVQRLAFYSTSEGR